MSCLRNPFVRGLDTILTEGLIQVNSTVKKKPTFVLKAILPVNFNINVNWLFFFL